MRTRISGMGNWGHCWKGEASWVAHHGMGIWSFFGQGNRTKWGTCLTVVKKHFEDLERSSNMRMARSWGETKLSAGLLVTWMLRQQRGRAECPGWCECKEWETENSYLGSWKASQSPSCPKLSPCHWQSRLPGNSLSWPGAKNRWSCLCCFQRSSNHPVNLIKCSASNYFLFSTPLFPVSQGVQVWKMCPSEEIR